MTMTVIPASVICPLCRVNERGLDHETNQRTWTCGRCARLCGPREHTHRYSYTPDNQPAAAPALGGWATTQLMVPLWEHGKHVGYRCYGNDSCDYIERTDGHRSTGTDHPVIVAIAPGDEAIYAVAVSLAAENHTLTADQAVEIVGIVYANVVANRTPATEVLELVAEVAPDHVDSNTLTDDIAAVFGYTER